MIVHKINIDEFDDLEYTLIAIHSGLEDYRLAYFINKVLQIRLTLCPQEIEIQTANGYGHFNHFLYDDIQHDVSWNLVPNKTFSKSETKRGASLFNDSETSFSSPIYLLPELKTIDFLLKIEDTDEQFEIDATLNKLNTLKFITTAYEIQQNKIKSKNNLIF